MPSSSLEPYHRRIYGRAKRPGVAGQRELSTVIEVDAPVAAHTFSYKTQYAIFCLLSMPPS